MGLRHDALAGAAEMMALIESVAKDRGDPLVATVGFVEVEPNTPNVVPGRVAFSVDARHTDGAALASFCGFLETALAEVARRRGLVLAWEPRLSVDPAPMSPGLQALIRQSCQARGLSHLTLPSGAGHDAQVMAGLCPTAMVFVPSRHGISHSPLEFSTHLALSDGLAVLSDVLYELAWKGASL
jgi:allantoate deiminase